MDNRRFAFLRLHGAGIFAYAGEWPCKNNKREGGIMLARICAWLSLVLLGIALAPFAARAMDQSFLAPASDADFILNAINSERPAFAVSPGVTGISVPHHLLAPDLIARGFWAASARQYKRLIIISPDHFRAVKGRFATTMTPAKTPFGTVETDQDAIAALLARRDLFEDVDLSHEHGVQALLPFAKHFFPDAVVVPVLASISTGEDDWREAARLLSAFADTDTLIIQSTDYSHYLPLSESILRDQETMAVMAAAGPESVEALLQPAHMDSKAAQYIQMTLQKEIYKASATIIGNRNSAEYSVNQVSTTSYLVSVFHPDPAAMSSARYDDQAVFYFGGDTLFGRFMRPILEDESMVSLIVDTVNRMTAGAPLIINLEGVLVDEPVANSPAVSHLMNTDLAGRFFKRMNVVAAGLANNHSYDFGVQGFEESRRSLHALGIKPLVDGEVSDLGRFRLLPLMLLSQTNAAQDDRMKLIDSVCQTAAAPPLVILAHWGAEYTSEAGPHEREIAEHLAGCGVAAIVGAHSHLASDAILNVSGRMQTIFSLGNFIFDQNGARSSGSLAELRIFRHGNVALRLIPIPNFYDLGNKMVSDR